MKVLLDVDGVLANFAEHCSFYHNRKNPYTHARNMGIYHIESIWGMSLKEFFAPLDEEFWATIPKMPCADPIVDLLAETFGLHNVCILTKPALTPGCLEGKRRWLNQHYPQLRNWMMATNKSFCAHSNSVLIDDSEKNCREFMDAGGRAFLMPAAWNRRWNLDEFEALEDYIGELRNQGLIL